MEDIITETQYKDLQEILSKEYVGREFVYKSKYGSETFGEVKEVRLSWHSTGDKETQRRIKVKMATNFKSGKIKLSQSDLEPVEVKRRWFGSQMNIIIISTTGNSYSLMDDKIYFILQK